ncbi:MAG: hypothetical protein ACKOXW_07290 [Actinomycetes bacterium]
MPSEKTSRCAVTRGELDRDAYASRDGAWRAIGLAAPARRALVDAGLTKLTQLSKWTRADLGSLHGMGPNALTKIDDALKASGFSYRT